MSIKKFIKDKILMTSLICFGLVTIEVFLIPYQFSKFIKLYIPIIILLLYLLGSIIEYNVKKRFYNKVFDTLDELDQKYLINEIITKPDFLEGRLLIEALEEIDKSMHENVNKYKYMRRRL